MVKRDMKNKMSHLFGCFANYEFSSGVQSFINRAYVNLLGLDMSEFAPPSTYPTLNKLFTRELKKRRRVDLLKNSFISPVDGLITECGKIDQNRAFQIKGMSYNIDELFTQQYSNEIKPLYGGTYMNFYLSPKDYHRYHMPYKLKVVSILHQPGKLYPVNYPSLRKTKNLFVENERVIVECFTESNRRIFIVLVGALNVGKITIAFDHRIKTNAQNLKPIYYKYDDKERWLNKGDLLGMFMMGSTVLVFAELGLIDLKIEAGAKVRFGQKVALIYH